MKYPGFIGPAYRAQSMIASPERLVNFYAERVDTPGAKNPVVYYPTPGLRAFAETPHSIQADTPQTNGRGLYSYAGRVFAVIGSSLYEVLAGGTLTFRADLLQGIVSASMISNGDGGGEVFIVAPRTGFIFTLSTSVITTEVTGVDMGDVLDGYFLALDASTSTLMISDLFDGKTWDPTQVAQRAIAPDPWRALIVANQRIWLFGSETTEVWYNAGTSPFPFAPVQGLLIPFGIAAPHSVKKVGTSLIWLAQTEGGQGQVVEAQGYDPQKISTFALDYAISTYGRIDDAVAWTYEERGHEFYVLNFPSAKATWCYDKSMGMWHERGTWDTELAQYLAWGPQYHVFAFGKHLVLDHRSGALFEMTPDVYTDVDGDLLRRERIPPALFSEHKRVFVDRFEVFLEAGLGLVSGQGSDPQVMLSWSRDGGKTFGAEHWRTAGELGHYSTRVVWNRCGSGRDLVPKLVMTDPIGWRLVDSYMTAREGRA